MVMLSIVHGEPWIDMVVGFLMLQIKCALV